MRALDAALDVFDGVSIADVRAKSLALTDLVHRLRRRELPGVDGGDAARAERGAARRSRCGMPHAYEVTQALIARGVIGDFRAPGPAAARLRAAVPDATRRCGTRWRRCGSVLDSQEWRDPRFARSAAAAVT